MFLFIESQFKLKYCKNRQQEIYSNLGVIYSALVLHKQAKHLFPKALKIKTDYTPAIYNLPGLNHEPGQKNKHSNFIKISQRLNPIIWQR